MSELKPMSAAEYRAHAEHRKDERPTEIVPLASGSIFELRRPDLSGYMKTGRLPHSLVSQSVNALSMKKTSEQIAKDLDDKDVIDSLIFMREIVHDCTVNPKFVEFATKDNEISASDMLPEDFDEIYAWAMGYKGVAGIEGLQSFRQGPARGVAADSPDGAELGDEAEPVVESIEPIQ